MSKLLTVFNFEFKNYFKRKSTIVVFVIYFVIAFGITFIPAIINGDSFVKKLFSGEDNSNFQRSAYIVKDVAIDKTYLKDAKEYSNRSQLEQDIKDEKIDEAIILSNDNYEYLSKSNSLTLGNTEFNRLFDNFVRQYAYQKNGLDFYKVAEVEKNIPKAKVTAISAKGDEENKFVNVSIIYFLSFALYFMILMFGSVMASNVAREKTNRAMELLVVTVKPTILIVGKVLAFSCIAVTQILLMCVSLLAGLKLNLPNYSEATKILVSNLDYSLIWVWVLFSLTGLVMFMFLFSAFASLVSRIEEVNTVMIFPTMIFIFAFFLNLFTMNDAGNGKFVEILSYIPLTSYFSMVTRYALAEVSMIELFASYAILLATTFLIALICIKVYRNATLRYGKKLSFWKVVRNK
ncbi:MULTISPECIES: ABC transporter permease [unclassified Gemella]|uniref:ABC transporter permease n=1 Tax=unclassified Gemella TaxID=2624949 RepID=UPI001C0439B7|nr:MULTISPECIES: ABC transporter permease [unclassified Gemella]MBU0278779.1 ABC transporter permease [Gemella sp. zg-1178]QWQ38717.1 ABC transporter permease [Gemella sp. zg-570]